MLTIATVAMILVTCILAWGGMALFDRIVRREYSHHREIWEADGKPCGYFWLPDDAPLRFNPAGGRLGCKWLFQRPPLWTRNDDVAAGLLRSYRIVGRSAIVGFVLFGLFFVLCN